MLLINGKETQIIEAMDRGIQFGDGCFTTAAVFYGKIILFSKHLERLYFNCERLHINFLHWKQLKQEMYKLAHDQERAVLKVIITRGSGDRGYNSISCTAPTRIVHLSSWPDHYDRWREQGIDLILSPIRLGRNPHLAGLKHLNRLEQVLIHAYLEQTSADEALVLDSEGWITECCGANLFWRKQNIVYTPCLSYAGVDGIMRQFCLRMLTSSSFQVTEIYAREMVLNEVEEIIICNSLIPLTFVKTYSQKKMSSGSLFNFLAPLCNNPDVI